MSGKRRHHERELKKQALVQAAELEALARGLSVDRSRLAPDGSYDEPDFVKRGYYVDKPFVCQACAKSQTWTATQQKWWYEVAKGGVWTTARFCRSCRQRERAQREEARLKGGDPNPYKNPGLLLARIRADLEPKLLSAGYRLAGRSRRDALYHHFLEYSRSDDLFTLTWDLYKARVAAELLTDGGADLRSIAAADFSGVRSTSDIEIRLAPFVAAVQSFLDGLREAPPEPESRRELSAPDDPSGVGP